MVVKGFGKWIVAVGVAVALVGSVISCAKKPAEKRMQPLTTVSVPAVDRFVAADHFRVGNDDPSEPGFNSERPMISLLDEDFERVFVGKVETKVPATTLNVHRVAMIGKGDIFLAELGERAETNLAHVWELLTRQPSSSYKGALYSERQSLPLIRNVFFVRGTDGNLWAIEMYWSEVYLPQKDHLGWVISAEPTKQPWDNDSRIFSR
jgi:hypothetical protein